MRRDSAYPHPHRMKVRIEAYKKYTEEKGEFPTWTGLAYYLGISRKVLWQYSKREEFEELLSNAKAWLESRLESAMLGQKVNVTGAIFSLKNNYGWKDTQDIVQETTHKTDVSNKEDKELDEIIERYGHKLFNKGAKRATSTSDKGKEQAKSRSTKR